jgi:hypothetical protein
MCGACESGTIVFVTVVVAVVIVVNSSSGFV